MIFSIRKIQNDKIFSYICNAIRGWNPPERSYDKSGAFAPM